MTVSVLTLTFISIDRWYAICFPLRYVSTNQRAIGSIAFIWMVALLSGDDNHNLYYFLYIYKYTVIPEYICHFSCSVLTSVQCIPIIYCFLRNYVYYINRSSLDCFSLYTNFHFYFLAVSAPTSTVHWCEQSGVSVPTQAAGHFCVVSGQH